MKLFIMLEWLAARKQYTMLVNDPKSIEKSAVYPTNQMISDSLSQLESYASLPFAAHVYESVLALVTSLQAEDVHLMHAQTREALGFLKKSPLLSFEQQVRFLTMRLIDRLAE